MRLIDVLTSPWAIVPEKFGEIKEIYARHVRGEKIDITALEARLGAPLASQPKPYEVQDGVALLALEGVLAKKMNLFTKISGGTSTQLFARDLRAAYEDPAVHALVIMIDSPGGSVDGTQELARLIADARGQDKPIVAWVDGLMASAAYWTGSAADAIYIGAMTDAVGSIGVAMEHINYAGADAKAGIERTEIYAGKYKRIASDTGPLTDEGRDYLQAQVDAIYTVFVDAVAQQRGVAAEQVLTSMADGRVFIGQQAIDNGLVDGAATLEGLIADLAAGRYTRKRSGAAGAAATRAATPASQSAGAAATDARTESPQSSISQSPGADMTINREFLNANHPDLVTAIRLEGYTAGMTEGRTAGAAAELARVLAVEASSLPGHEALIAKLKTDGTTTGPEAAVQVLSAEKARGANRLANIAADGASIQVAAHASTSGETASTTEQSHLPLDERCQAKWDSDAAIRAEFGSYAVYLGYEKGLASGRVKVMGARKAA